MVIQSSQQQLLIYVLFDDITNGFTRNVLYTLIGFRVKIFRNNILKCLTYVLNSQYYHILLMVNGKSKMYTYNHTWYENFPKRNKIMFLEYYPHNLLMILTYMS